MFYPTEFKRKVYRLYPENEDMHKCMEKGSELLGRYLCDGSLGSIPISEVLKANSLRELKCMAMTLQEKKDLYAEWKFLYDHQMHV